jgi:hypothetical protein
MGLEILQHTFMEVFDQPPLPQIPVTKMCGALQPSTQNPIAESLGFKFF